MKVNMEHPNDLLLEDLEQLLREIDDFNTAVGNNKSVDIPQSLENYLHFVAKSGNTVFPWPHVRSLFRAKMVNAIQQFQEPTSQNESFVLDRFDYFRLAAPFTVQRLTELILQPTRHYRKKEKFLRGLEKTVVVVSTVEPRSLMNDAEKNGNEGNDITSCEDDPENNSFNRTFTLNRQEMLRASSIDIINQSLQLPLESPDGILLDTVTTSAVTAAVDVMKQNLGMPGDVIIPESVTDPNVAAMGLITPDITIAVSSDSIILDPVVSDASAASLVSIEAEPDAVSAMECESSTVADPSALVQCVTEEDLLSQAAAERLTQAQAGGGVLEGVSSTLVTMDAVELPIRIDAVETVNCEPSISATPAEVDEQTKNLIPLVSMENDANLATSTGSSDTDATDTTTETESSDSAMEVVPPLEAEVSGGEEVTEKSEAVVLEQDAAPCEASVSSLTAPIPAEPIETEMPLSTSSTDDPSSGPETQQQDVELEDKTSEDITDTDELKSSETETPSVEPAPSEAETIPMVGGEKEKLNPDSGNIEETNSDASGVTDSSAAVENA